MKRRWLFTGVVALVIAGSAWGGPIFLQGLAPDWNQPYAYVVPNGPGPDPRPGQLDPWNAWCAPSSAANLVGYWQDQWGKPVADGFVAPNTGAWPVASWHDYQADGTNGRPAAGGGVPAVATDFGYYMDTNNGGMARGNGPHAGTYLRDIHAGLATHFGIVDALGGWTTGTQGRGFAAGLAPNGQAAVLHGNMAAAFNEIVTEINASRPMMVSWTNWNIVPSGLNPIQGQGQGEGSFDTEFYDWSSTAPDPWGNDESWNYDEGGGGLGHTVTAVGYLLANDALNPRPGTDWVIVHDNIWQTPRNIAVPMNWNAWVANTNAVPEPTTLLLLALGAAGVLRRRA